VQRASTPSPYPPPEPWLATTQKRLHAFLVVFRQARQRELVDVHVASEIIERVGEPVDRQFGHGDRERRLERPTSMPRRASISARVM
jgi:hypothetical protein